MKKEIIYIILLFIILPGCSSEEKVKKGDKELSHEELYIPDLNLKFKEVYSWINLMPGPDAKPRFNITGEIELYESTKYDLKFMNLSLIDIYQNDEKIYSIKPEVRENKDLSSTEMKFLIFSTIKGLLLDSKLNIEQPVDARFIFVQDNDEYPYFIKAIKIEKAY